MTTHTEEHDEGSPYGQGGNEGRSKDSSAPDENRADAPLVAPRGAPQRKGLRPPALARPTSRTELEGLIAVRFFAAATIILYHLVTIPALAAPRSLGFIEKYFSYGVPLFYMVSAFGLFYGYAGRFDGPDALVQFYKRRFFRIAPLFYVMMTLYFCLSGFNVPIEKVVSSGLFLFNLIPQHVEGYVWASWSIGVEMAFYATLPLLAMTVTRLRHAVAFAMLSLFLADLWLVSFGNAPPPLGKFGQFSLIAYLLYFAAGVVALQMYRALRNKTDRAQRRVGLGFLTSSLFGILAFMALGSALLQPVAAAVGEVHATILTRAIWALLLAVFMLGIVLAPIQVLVNRGTLRIGLASFSLYLWHPLIIGALARAGVYERVYDVVGGKPALGLPLSAGLTIAILVPLALTSYELIEKPGMRLGQRSSLRLGQRQPESASR